MRDKIFVILLVLITAALASCQEPRKNDWEPAHRTYLRSDTTAPYTRAHHGSGLATGLLWYYAFRPYGHFSNGQYNRAGYYSGALHRASNVGANATKSGIVRGGFGRSGRATVSS